MEVRMGKKIQERKEANIADIERDVLDVLISKLLPKAAIRNSTLFIDSVMNEYKVCVEHVPMRQGMSWMSHIHDKMPEYFFMGHTPSEAVLRAALAKYSNGNYAEIPDDLWHRFRPYQLRGIEKKEG